MFSRILFECHKVLFHQINAWIVHGQLMDLCEEFFIHRMERDHQTQGRDTESVLNKT